MELDIVQPPVEAPAGDEDLLNLGTLLGRHQAFGLIANKCSAADAQTLREIRDRKLYKRLDLSWADFCQRHAGVCSRTADQIIARLDEFGESYFNFSRIIPIRAADYRQIAPAISDDILVVDGERIEITRENTLRLIDAVTDLRARLRQRDDDVIRARKEFDHQGLWYRFDALIDEIHGHLSRKPGEDERKAMCNLLDYVWEGICGLNRVLRPRVQIPPPVPEPEPAPDESAS